MFHTSARPSHLLYAVCEHACMYVLIHRLTACGAGPARLPTQPNSVPCSRCRPGSSPGVGLYCTYLHTAVSDVYSPAHTPTVTCQLIAAAWVGTALTTYFQEIASRTRHCRPEFCCFRQTERSYWMMIPRTPTVCRLKSNSEGRAQMALCLLSLARARQSSWIVALPCPRTRLYNPDLSSQRRNRDG